MKNFKHNSTDVTRTHTSYSRRHFLELTLGVTVAGLVGCNSSGKKNPSGDTVTHAIKRIVADLSGDAITRFKQQFEGEIIMPADPSYESLRRIWNFKFNKRPGMIAVCANVDDVQRTVSFAAEHNLLLAVRGGGHSIAGFSTCDGGIALLLSRLNEVNVDAGNSTVEILGGATIGSIDYALSNFGLATPGASAATVGYGGFSTGGGRGTISPRYGLACDNIQEFDLVTSDGRLLTASASNNSDLFWAVRGGGGNYGVVTRFKVKAHSISKIVGGRLVYPIKNANDTLRQARDLFQSLPSELYVAPSLAGTPDGPVVVLNLLYCGSSEHANSAIAPFRAIKNSIADTIAELSYLDSQGWFPGPPLGTATEGCAGFFLEFSDEIINAMIASANAGPASFAIPCFSNHGALADKSIDNNAFPLRIQGVDFFAMGFWTSQDEREKTELWAKELWTSVADAAVGTLVNGFFSGNSSTVIKSYQNKYERLAKIKADYDPNNLFSQNANIIPSN